MLSLLLKPFAGRHYRKFLERTRPIVVKINELDRSFTELSDDQLRAKTEEFQARIKAGETLEQILAEAFATVKNAARRLLGRTATVCEHEMVWDMVHFDVQLVGGIALHEGRISEMATGEGKTLVATLPLYLNCLNGRNAQLVTVNDYLARRDSEWMGILYSFLGVSVGCIQQSMSPDLRREMYGRNITYGTASEFGFDYLRDNGMATRKEDQVQRDHWYCIVDKTELVSKAYHFDGQVVFNEAQLVAQRAEMIVLAQQPAQHLGKLHHHHARLVRVGANQRRYRIDRVEKEVRVDLAGQRGQPRLH